MTKAETSNSKLGNLSKKNHLKYRESFMYKCTHCSTIYNREKKGGEQSVLTIKEI